MKGIYLNIHSKGKGINYFNANFIRAAFYSFSSKRNIGAFILLLISIPVFAQFSTEYSFGVDSRGNYGFALNRQNDNNLFSISYANLNIANFYKFNPIASQQNIFTNQVNSWAFTYLHKKPLSSSLNLYYGTNIMAGTSPFKNSISENKYSTNFSIQVGVTYKLTDKITIGAEFQQGYGNYWLNQSMPLWFNASSPNQWLLH
jgi:hypothetical protein